MEANVHGPPPHTPEASGEYRGGYATNCHGRRSAEAIIILSADQTGAYVGDNECAFKTAEGGGHVARMMTMLLE